MEKKQLLLKYQTPTVVAVLVFDDVYTDALIVSDEAGNPWPWD